MGAGEFYDVLDTRFHADAPRLSEELPITQREARFLSATVYREVAERRAHLRGAWPDQMPIEATLTAFERYQHWTTLPQRPNVADSDYPAARVADAIAVADHVVHFYMNFVYLRDGLFSVLAEHLSPQAVAARCSKFVQGQGRGGRQPMRRLRNAVAHGRWTYEAPATLVYWDRASPTAFTRYTCSVDDLNFYMRVVTRVGWPALAALAE